MTHPILRLLSCLAVFLCVAAAHAQTTRTIAYQGTLEHNGEPLDQTVPMVFHFYGAATAGTPLQSIPVSDVDVRRGRFSLDIGPIDDVVFDSPALYLAVEVDGVQLEGRTRIRGVPYAIRGETVGDFRVVDLEVAEDAFVLGDASFGQQPRQMLNLYGTSYGIGVQASTLYLRSDQGFAWHQGGVHSDGEAHPGGGTRLMQLGASGDLNVMGTVTSETGIAPGAAEPLRMVRGTVHANGVIDEGTGFSVARPNTGVFDITFSPAFSAPPTIVCSGMHPTDANNTNGVVPCLVNNPKRISASSARIIISTVGGNAANYPFSFIAVGPK